MIIIEGTTIKKIPIITMEILQLLPYSLKITNLLYTNNLNNLFTLYDAKVIRLSHTA